MRFVEFEISRSQHRQSNQRQGCDEKPNRSCLAHSAGRTTKLGCRAKICGAHLFAAQRQINSSAARIKKVSAAAKKIVPVTSLGQCAPNKFANNRQARRKSSKASR